jgi:hypothetical protein
VKSRKHEWDEACFIPDASDATNVERVARRFIELQGDALVGGLVFREFERFATLPRHPQSGMPRTQEFRVFHLDGAPLVTCRYWESDEYDAVPPPAERFGDVARQVRTRFFAMDVALREDGVWRVVEIGDGQVSGLLEAEDPVGLYRSLAAVLTG